jgi:FkbM family methyltransferase
MRPPYASPVVFRPASKLLELPAAPSGVERVASGWSRRLSQQVAPSDRFQERRMRHGGTLMLDLCQPQQGKAFLLGRYEQAVIGTIAQHLPLNGVFVDAGANIGLVTIAIASLRPDVTIYAIEAHPGNAETLRQNIGRNPGTRATVFERALSREPGALVLNLGEQSGHHHLGGEATNGSVEVQASTLDDLSAEAGIERIDVLKIDIEGAETEAFRGAARLLQSRAIGTIVAEVRDSHLSRMGSSEAELVALLSAHGLTGRRISQHEMIFEPSGTSPG